MRGDYARAIAHYNAALRLDPEYAAFNGRGSAFAAGGVYDRAIADYDEALRLDPSFSAARGNRDAAARDRAAAAASGQPAALEPVASATATPRRPRQAASGTKDSPLAAEATRID